MLIGRNEKIAPPPLFTITVVRGRLLLLGIVWALFDDESSFVRPYRALRSWSVVTSPQTSVVGFEVSAQPVAVDMIPSIPLAPRLTETREGAQCGFSADG